MSKITWTLRTFEIDTLTDYAKNPRSLTDAQFNKRLFACQSCGKLFQSEKACKSRTPKYCSRECASIAKIKWSICLNCGGNYCTSKETGQRNKLFCSMKCAAKYKTGKPFTYEHKKALSDAKIGKPIPHLHTPEIIAKISKSLTGKPQPWMRGVLHPRYKNGGVGFSERLVAMGMLEYKEWRRAIFARDGYLCQVCFKKNNRLHAHHIKSWSDNIKLRYDIDNGKTLCVDCHRDIHRK